MSHNHANGNGKHHNREHDRELDPTQLALLDEICILVDPNDRAVGQASKGQAHLMTEIKKGMLHRAFSIFLFNSKNELLLQQRASEKITFPDYWTNTCCSHPLVTPDGSEQVEKDSLGVKRAAKRKLEHELNIVLPLEAFKLITRILYLAPSDGKWGEHELDYVLFAYVDDVDITSPNRNEVRALQWVSQDRLREMISESKLGKIRLTPWFDLISDTMLFDWWSAGPAHINSKASPNVIHKLGPQFDFALSQ